MTKQRAFERKLIADALRSVLLAQYLQSQTSTWEILLLAGKKALEGRIREGLYNKMSLVDICKISIQQIHVSSQSFLPIGHPLLRQWEGKGVPSNGWKTRCSRSDLRFCHQFIHPRVLGTLGSLQMWVLNSTIRGPLQLWCFLIHCQDFYTKIFRLTSQLNWY